MSQKKNPSIVLTACCIIGLLIFPSPVFAYLDPSTGSMVVSALVGIFASIALGLKTYWYKIKAVFSGKSKSRSKSVNDTDRDD